MSTENGTDLVSLWREIGTNLQLLMVAGFFGALVRGMLAPEGKLKARLVQGVVGIFSALFLGAFLGGFFEGIVAHPAYAYLASGFICGTAGEVIIAYAQRKILGDDK